MTAESEVLTLNAKLLDSIDRSDYQTYSSLTANDMTCFEPDALGTFVEGKPFHKWFLDQFPKPSKDHLRTSNICNPKVRMLGPDAALVTYIRLDQNRDGATIVTRKYEETRVWQIIKGQWTLVHFHKSAVN